MTSLGRFGACCLFAALMTQPALARNQGASPEKGQEALRSLLLVSAEKLDEKTSCGTGLPGEQQTVADLLASVLSYQIRGENSITGNCSGSATKKCSIHLRHSNGEDVSSADIDFDMREGRASVGSLRCRFTP